MFIEISDMLSETGQPPRGSQSHFGQNPEVASPVIGDAAAASLLGPRIASGGNECGGHVEVLAAATSHRGV